MEARAKNRWDISHGGSIYRAREKRNGREFPGPSTVNPLADFPRRRGSVYFWKYPFFRGESHFLGSEGPDAHCTAHHPALRMHLPPNWIALSTTDSGNRIFSPSLQIHIFLGSHRKFGHRSRAAPWAFIVKQRDIARQTEFRLAIRRAILRRIKLEGRSRRTSLKRLPYRKWRY